jgi:uncharacterized protein (DUF362 family)
MNNIVGVIRGQDKFSSFASLMEITGFDQVLLETWEESGKEKKDFKVIIKPNMMVFVNQPDTKVLVTDKDLVESLIDRILDLGFSDIIVCEAQNDVGRMLHNHNVFFVAEKIGYNPNGRYRIVDLSLESLPYTYTYLNKKGGTKRWKDTVGKSWQEADFRITFAKCKTHEHDWLTLGVKNVYGCFPAKDKVSRYHIIEEVYRVTARLIRNFPVHFSFVDAWTGSDGFQGYKIAHPQELKILFGGRDPLAVDMEIFQRAELDPFKSKFLRHLAAQLESGQFPQYEVRGDLKTLFSHLTSWENLSDEIVKRFDFIEEIYISWAFINLKAASDLIDYKMFPPRNLLVRFSVFLTKKIYDLVKIFQSKRH